MYLTGATGDVLLERCSDLMVFCYEDSKILCTQLVKYLCSVRVVTNVVFVQIT